MKITRQLTLLVAGLGVSVFAHACQIPKSYYKHVSCTARAGVYLAVKDDGAPVALLDKKGEKMTDLFAYERALGGEFHSGLLPVKKGGKVGYINEKGKVVVNFNYQPMNGGAWARGVHEGRIVVRQNGGFGVIDTTGKTIVKADKSITSISDFVGGRATVVTKSGTYAIDKSGQKLPSAPTAMPQYTPNTKTTDTKTSLPKPTVQMALFPRQVDGKWGFVDGDGVPMIRYVFDEVKPYSEGLAGVRQGDKWGFIDVGGNLVVPFRFEVDGFDFGSEHLPKYKEPLTFYQGKAWIANLHDGTKLCINKKGTNVEC
ncbi:WG repeat-containing protein [Moraxella oblonga]|uniref:WG repeat-containing protein n=1 Tax=Moraxella oblonga TaxID=200413 RepID=UPI000831335E|nr:WG repeat-containing protein [Moraxella oblonga]